MGASAGLCLDPDRYTSEYTDSRGTTRLDPPGGPREAFVRDMLQRDDVTWVSNEGAGVLPDVTAQVDRPVEGRTIVAVDGRATALVGPHGQSYEAF